MIPPAARSSVVRLCSLTRVILATSTSSLLCWRRGKKCGHQDCEQSNCYQDLCDNFFVFTLPGVCLNDGYYQGIYSKYVVHGYCKLKLPFIFFVGQIYFQLVFFVASLLKVSFLPYSLLLMLMVCGRQAPRLVAGSEEVRAVRWGAQFTVGCLGTFPGVYEPLAEADNYQSSSGVWLMAPHPATPRSFCLLMSYHNHRQPRQLQI